MNVKIIEEKQAPLLSRKEIKLELTFEKATPSNEEVKKQVASQTKADESLVVVKEIYTKFGSAEATGLVYVYDSKEEMDKIEPKKKEKKAASGTQTKSDASQAKPAEGAAPAAEKKEEAPAEKKDEAPKEKKAEEKPAEKGK